MPTKVIIIGAGFGGLRAARTLANNDHVDVLLIDQHNFHCFQPLLYQVATAGLEPEQIAYPVRAIIRRWQNVRFLMARVEGIDRSNRTVQTTCGAFEYDHLIIAAGGRTNFFNLPGVAEHGFGLKTLADAERLRNHILTTFERAAYEDDKQRLKAMRTFVVVGGGPTGVEMAGALYELVRNVLTRDYRDLNMNDVRIILLEATDQILAMLPPQLQRKALKRLEQMGVEVRLNTAVVQASDTTVELKDGTQIPSYTLIWAAGIRGVELANTLEDALVRGGRLKVRSDLRLADDPHVWIIGDLAFIDSGTQPLPQVAPVAIQQGATAARNILAQESGQATTGFTYVDRGTMATIGRHAAVARIFGISLWGYPAWLIWLVVHLMSLIGFRNRVVVLINWAYNYIFYERAVRIITRPAVQPEANVLQSQPGFTRAVEASK